MSMLSRPLCFAVAYPGPIYTTDVLALSQEWSVDGRLAATLRQEHGSESIDLSTG